MAEANLLVSVDDLKARMAINADLLGIDGPLESAIRASQLRVASFFDSQLQKAVHTEVFFLDSDAFSGIQAAGLYRVMLGNAFISEDPAPVITFGSKWNDCNDEPPATDLVIDSVRGLLALDADTFHDKYVKVVYTSGYESDGEIPDWMKEAILAYAPVVFNMGQVTNRSAEAEPGYKISGDHALALLAPYTRNKGMSFRPLY